MNVLSEYGNVFTAIRWDNYSSTLEEMSEALSNWEQDAWKTLLLCSAFEEEDLYVASTFNNEPRGLYNLNIGDYLILNDKTVPYAISSEEFNERFTVVAES